jgi:hypothetical protein
VAGESPGREQQHGTSGEPEDRIAPDPRLALLRMPTETPEAGVTGDLRERASAGGREAATGRAPGKADETLVIARPASARASDASSRRNTSDGVSPVDAKAGPATTASASAPRVADAAPQKNGTES